MTESLSPTLIRAIVLYLPLFVLFDAWIWKKPRFRERTGLLLSFLWAIPSLFLVHLLAISFGLWSFDASGGTFYGMPVDFLIGWAILWGPLPLVLLGRQNLLLVTGIMVALDFVAMPLLHPVLHLGPYWLFGEAAAAALCLVPAQLLGRWTRDGHKLEQRVFLQILCVAGLFMLFLPAIVLFHTQDNTVLPLGGSVWINAIVLQLFVWPSVIGLSAVQEFAQRGRGTPIPFDPTQRLVTTGIYRYVRNPMQLSFALLSPALAIFFTNWWMLGVSVVGVAYGIGLANWSEANELRERFGEEWNQYRLNTRNWIPRLTPYAPRHAKLYVAGGCRTCTEFGNIISRLRPIGLDFVPAEYHPGEKLSRITYECDGIAETGVRAIGRALEHVNIAWAILGCFMRLPVLSSVLQLIADSVAEVFVIENNDRSAVENEDPAKSR